MTGTIIVDELRSQSVLSTLRSDDPANPSVGDRWVRDDVTPTVGSVTAIGVVRIQGQNGTQDWPIISYDDEPELGADVYPGLRLRWNESGGFGTTTPVSGFVPVTDQGGSLGSPRLVYNGTEYQAHDSLTVGSDIPDTLVVQQFATTWSQGDSIWVDDVTDDESQDVSITGDPQDGTLSDGSESLNFNPDGDDDYGSFAMPSSLDGSGLNSFAVEFATQWSHSDGRQNIFGLRNNDADQQIFCELNADSSFSSDAGNLAFGMADNDGNRMTFDVGRSDLNDGSRKDISIIVNDASTRDVEIIINGTNQSLVAGETLNPDNFAAWDGDIYIHARDGFGGGVSQYLEAQTGAMRWHDPAIPTQTIDDYS